jgi:hypothetical protein
MTIQPSTGGSAYSSPFHQRGCVVFILGMSAAVLILSGIVLFFAPSSKIAQSLGWGFLLLGRGDWINLHNAAAILFCAVMVWHLRFNWKSLHSYVIGHRPGRLPLRKELAAALGALLILVVLVGLAVPPISTLGDISNYFRHEYWGQSAQRVSEPGKLLDSQIEFPRQLSALSSDRFKHVTSPGPVIDTSEP